MRVLITGAGGLLGSALAPCFRDAGHTVTALSRRELDVTDRAAVGTAFADCRPELVLHTAAYTRVDQAESEPEQARAVNRDGTAWVAEAASRHRSALVYISSDYVFAGGARQPIPVDAPTGPLGVYGRTKLEGEILVRERLPQHWIVRTSWLYGAGGPNFVDTMRRLAGSQPLVKVVHDQVGSPTWSVELARVIRQLVVKGPYGTYHATCQGHCSWYEFAKTIWQELELATPLAATSTADLARPAPRPAYSVLDQTKLQGVGIEPLHWQEALRHYLHGRVPLGAGR